MLITVILFWISISLLFFCYIGYGLLLFLFNRVKRIFTISKKKIATTDWMPVTIIIPAFNEGEVLEKKIENTLSLDYPDGKIRIIFVTDGSTDGSEKMIEKHPSLVLLHTPERRGKLAAIKRGMQHADTPIVVFSDANVMLNKESILKIARHYDDPKTGGVAGEKKIISDRGKSLIGNIEGIYWKYESFMKKQDAEFNTVVGAAGELFSIRTELFPELSDKIILDDFVITMKICLQNYKINYEPGAYAAEFPSASLAEEEKRKIRIIAGAYQSIGCLKGAMNIFKHPLLSFQYTSRRLLRWIICPLMLIILLVTNILIADIGNSHLFYTYSLGAQILFYVTVAIGWLTVRSGKDAGILAVPFYFVFMNYCLVKGFIRFLNGKQSVLWEKSIREAVA